ncbi:aldose epimerase family protein [Amycolatopsis jejuensis]|uniref:aldose epimerase family protein n=1 Tax=Amycolatopsis jejuensis TaxID=330084 RepID=UPI000526EE94|nr:aldose epimerase family protein [Amycolatopsis jejuensis]
MSRQTERTMDGFPVRVVTLENEHTKAVVTDIGARLLELHVPDRNGTRADVVLGRPSFKEMFDDRSYLGATAGRYAGRIARGRFTLDGKEYQLATNEGANHLHGGTRGFDQYAWSTVVHDDEEAVTFYRLSGDGEEGFPGSLATKVTYRLDGPSLGITMSATTDQPTIVRLVHHSYWNLSGHDSGTILDHVLQLNSSHYIPVDAELLPHGEVRPVEGNPYDFRKPKTFGQDNALIENSGAGRVSAGSAGYDDIWVLDGSGMRVVGSLTDPASGRRLELATDQPGVCIYVGGYLDGEPAKGGGTYPAFAGVTLETTGFPDDVNFPHFPSPVLRPGEVYTNQMRLTFSAA